MNTRRAIASATKAVVRGDMRTAASEARVAGSELGGKVKDEAQRVRAILTGRK